MNARAYVILLATAAAGILTFTMAANILIDPQAVFGTGLVAVHLNPNGRYRAYQMYEAAATDVDAVLFASSRGRALDRALLAQHFGVRSVGNFSVPFGMISDYLPVLEFLLRDKAARGQRLRAIFVLLDADYFGEQPW